MRRHDYLITYDISDPKRLVKVAKRLDRSAFRIQYSVFLFYDATALELRDLMEELVLLIDEKEDDLRSYRIEDYGFRMGNAIDLSDPMELT
ncbi:CRISPR-associated endonuclease Cas2 [Nitratifractor sp.]